MMDKITPTDESSSKPISDKPVDPSMLDIETLDVASGNNRFAIDFYKQISDNDENVFFSPISIYMAFSALYEGARHDTAEQMQQVLKLEPDSETRHTSIKQFTSYINQDDPYATLTMANALWLADWLVPHETYVDSIREFYNADVETLDLPNTGEKRIDRWAEENTNGIINDIISPDDLDADTASVITNAIYFAGEWEHQFPIELTVPHLFWKNSKESVDIYLMHNEKHFHYTYMNKTQILKMPYKGDRLSMLVMLPDDRDGIKSLEKFITPKVIEQWRMNLELDKVQILMPKFKIETDYNLAKYLTQLGMQDAFIPNTADLSGISGDNLYVSKAIQKAFVDVDEIGTKATAVSLSISQAVSGPETFLANHPFIFIIQDDETGAILFMGRVSDPTM